MPSSATYSFFNPLYNTILPVSTYRYHLNLSVLIRLVIFSFFSHAFSLSLAVIWLFKAVNLKLYSFGCESHWTSSARPTSRCWNPLRTTAWQKKKQCCVKKKTSFGLRELKCSWENENGEDNEMMNGCLGRWVGWIRAEMFHSWRKGSKRTALTAQTPPLVSQHHSEWLWQHLSSMLLVTWLQFLPRTLRLKHS